MHTTANLCFDENRNIIPDPSKKTRISGNTNVSVISDKGSVWISRQQFVAFDLEGSPHTDLPYFPCTPLPGKALKPAILLLSIL